MKELEICCDASIKLFPNGRTFGCAGAVAIGYNKEVFRILPDSTNNRSELIAIYLAVKLAQEISEQEHFDKITIYSDSKFGIYGLRVWMDGWLQKRDSMGIMYNYNNEPVKNQELFLMIISYLVTNNLKIAFRHQKGHINYNSEKSIGVASRVFQESNGYVAEHSTIHKISFYNDTIDKHTRMQLASVDPDTFAVMDRSNDYVHMCKYIVPDYYKDYIL